MLVPSKDFFFFGFLRWPGLPLDVSVLESLFESSSLCLSGCSGGLKLGASVLFGVSESSDSLSSLLLCCFSTSVGSSAATVELVADVLGVTVGRSRDVELLGVTIGRLGLLGVTVVVRTGVAGVLVVTIGRTGVSAEDAGGSVGGGGDGVVLVSLLFLFFTAAAYEDVCLLMFIFCTKSFLFWVQGIPMCMRSPQWRHVCICPLYVTSDVSPIMVT